MPSARWLALALALTIPTLAPTLAQDAPPEPAPPAEKKPAKLSKYPKDITPPKGTQYPCALTALPREQVGVPEEQRAWTEHCFAEVLRAIHAKLVLLEKLRTGEKGAKLQQAHKAYEKTTREVVARLQDPAPPEAVKALRDDVVAALGGQLEFFAEALKKVEGKPHPAGYDSIWQIPAGKAASQKLLAAWAKAQGLWKGWDTATRESVYHHLCALDLF